MKKERCMPKRFVSLGAVNMVTELVIPAAS